MYEIGWNHDIIVPLDIIYPLGRFCFIEEVTELIISACGNDCSLCPRFMPKTDEELKSTAFLWHKIGYRDQIVSNEEIACYGCKPGNFCTYKIIECTKSHGISNCGECDEYPCNKIIKAFERTAAFEATCREICTEKEYKVLKNSAFCKQDNLDRIKNQQNRKEQHKEDIW